MEWSVLCEECDEYPLACWFVGNHKTFSGMLSQRRSRRCTTNKLEQPVLKEWWRTALFGWSCAVMRSVGISVVGVGSNIALLGSHDSPSPDCSPLDKSWRLSTQSWRGAWDCLAGSPTENSDAFTYQKTRPSCLFSVPGIKLTATQLSLAFTTWKHLSG